MLQILTSDEANFELHGNVNSQNVQHYAPLKTSNPEDGGRPAEHIVDKPINSPKFIVFCGMKRDGTFGLRVFHNYRMTGASYHSLLQYKVFSELRLNGLWWQQDGAPVQSTIRNMAYQDNQF